MEAPQHNLKRHAAAWRRLIKEPLVVSWVAKGYPLPLDAMPRIVRPQPQMNKQKEEVLNKHIQQLVDKGAVARVERAAVKVCLPVFIIPKKARGKYRLIHDLRALNACMTAVQSFRLPGLKDMHEVAKPNDWLVTWDLEAGYQHVSMEEASTPALGFQWKGAFFKFLVLPFGLSTAPYVFQRIMLTAAGVLRRKGIRVIVYLDDWMLLASSRKMALHHRAVAAVLMVELGLVRERTKGQWEPVQAVEFLGFLVDTVAQHITLTAEKATQAKRVISCLRRWARTGSRQHWRCVARKVGFLAALRPSLPHVGLFLARLYASLRGRRGQDKTTLHPATEADLHGLADWMAHHPAAPLFPPGPATVTLETDASDMGWGAALRLPGRSVMTAHGTWSTEQRALHITEKEALGLKMGLAELGRHMEGRSVHLRLDATAVIWAVRKMNSRSPRLAAVMREVFKGLSQRHCRIAAVEYVPSEEHTLPDRLSRLKAANEQRVAGWVWHRATSRWGKPEVDRFASSSTNVVPRFNAWICDDKAEAIDALAQDWRHSRSWAFPPTALVGRTVALIEQQRAPTLLFAPHWTTASWWPKLEAVTDEVMAFHAMDPVLDRPDTTSRWPMAVYRCCGY